MANIYSTLTYNANLSPAQAQIKALTGQIGTLTAAFNTLDKSALRAQASLASTFMANVGQIGGFTSKIVGSTTAVDNFGKSLAKQRLTMRQYFREAIAGYTKQNSMMKQLAAQQVAMQQSTLVPMGAGRTAVVTPSSMAAMGNAAALASQKFSIFNELIRGGSERLLNFGKNTQWTGRQLMVGFTLPLVMITALVSKQFREIDKELTRFQKVYGEDLTTTVENSTERMRAQVEQLAYDISSSYGIAAKETAALAADIAQTGKEGEELLASIKQTTRLSVLGEVDRQEAMRATLSIQNAFKLNTNELAESIDFLNAVENQTSTTLNDLAGAIPRVGPVIQSLGGDIKDMSLLLVAMREGGVSAAEAANALKSGLGRLINPTKQAREVAAGFGVSLEDIIQNSKGQLLPMIFGLQDALQGLDDFSRAQVIEKIFGKYQFARISALFENLRRQGSQTLSVMELAGASTSELAGIANKEIRELQESSSMRFQRTIENLKNSLIPLGNILTETLIPILSGIGSGIKGAMDFFQSLPEPVRNFTKYIIAVTALAGPVVMLVGLFGNLIANGIKFAMTIVRLGARMAGLKFEKFELLTADVMAARNGIENLNTSFLSQEQILKRLNAAMSSYAGSITHLMRTNPGLFVNSGLTPASKGVPIIRRAKGSRSPEQIPGGYGGGDTVPALLEPGEFVVRKEAAKKYGPILLGMNRGTVQEFQNAGPVLGVPSDINQRNPVRHRSHATPYVDIPARTARNYASQSRQYMIDAEIAAGRNMIRLFSNLVFDLTQSTNTLLKTTGVQGQYLAQQFANSKTYASIMAMTGLSWSELQPVATRLEAIFSKMGAELVDDPLLYKTVDKALKEVSISGTKAGQALTTLSGQFGTFAYGPSQQRTKLGSVGSGVRSYTDIGGLRPTSRLYTADTMASGLKRSVVYNMDKGLVKSTESHSPSRKAEVVGYQAGVNLGNGAVNGLKRGMQYSTNAGAKMLAGPVGPGLESRNIRSQIATKESSILKFTELQEKAARRRTVAEGQILNIQLEIQRIMKRTDITLSEKLAITELLKRQILEQKAVIQNSTIAEKRASDNIVQAKNQVAALMAKSPYAGSFIPAAATTGPAGNLSGLAVTGGVQGARPSTNTTTGIFSSAKPTKPSMTVSGGGGGVKPSVTGVSGGTTVSATGLSSTPSKPTGPSASLASARSQARPASGGMMGGGAMNAMFAISMLGSSFAMLGGQSNDAAMKLSMFTSALMAATLMMNSGMGKGIFRNFLGMGTLGKKAAVRGRAMNIAAGGASRGGAALMGLGRGLSLLGGPVGIAAGIGITGAIAGFMAYKKAAEEARDRSIAAFMDPVKSAEYFGQTISDISKVIEKNKLSNVAEGIQEIDDSLREAVKEDYGPLIEKIENLSAGAGAQQLAVAYSNMIVSGMSADAAKTTIEAIATEAGTSGGEAFAEAMQQGFLDQEITIAEALKNIVGQFTPEETMYGKTGQTIAEKLQEDIQQTEAEINRILAGRQRVQVAGQQGPPSYTYANPGDSKRLAQLNDQLDQLRDRLEDLQTIRPELVGEVINSLTMAYQQDPSAAVQGVEDFANAINKLDEGDKAAAIEELTNYLKQNYQEAWDAVGDSIDTDTEKIIAMKMIIQGISFDRAIDGAYQFSTALAIAEMNAKALYESTAAARAESEQQYFGMIDEFFADKRIKLEADIEVAQEEKDALERDLQEKYFGDAEFVGGIEIRNPLQREEEALDDLRMATQAFVQDKEDLIDAYQEEMDVAEEKYDAEIEALEEQKDLINESTDAYINSIEKRQKADSFYANQRKTSLSALQKLASGDVFGFLQDRQQMSQEAQEFSYEQQIQQIEDRRDAEVQAIEDAIDARREEHEKYKEAMEEKIQLERDLIEQQQRALSDREFAHQIALDNYEDEMLASTAKKDLEIQNTRDELDFIANAEKDYRENSKAAEAKYSEEYSELKTKPYVEARKEFFKLRVEEIYFRGGITLQDAILQAGFSGFGDRRGRSAAAAIQNAIEELGITLPATMWQPERPAGASDVWRTEEVPSTGITPPFSAEDVTIQDPSNVYINGVDVGGGGSVNYDGTPDTDNNPATLGVATGGYISGPGTPTSDSIPARLSNGEYVVRASSVRKYGKGMMDEINAARFAEGGYVGKANPKYVSGRDFPEVSPPAGDTPSGTGANGGASGTPLFDETILKNLGHSLTTAKNVLGFLDTGGWPRDLHRLAWTIAMRESGGNPSLYHDHLTTPSLYSPGNGDYGLFQINKRAFGSQPWFDTQRLLDGSYNASVAYKYLTKNGTYFLPWGMKRSYNGTNAGFDWSAYPGGSGWRFAAPTMQRTNALWPAFLGYRGGTTPAGSGSGYTGGGTGAAQNAVQYAMSRLGAPYVGGGAASPPTSFDCSKFTAWSWAVGSGGSPNSGYNDPNAKVRLTPYSHTQGQQIQKRVMSRGYGQPISGLVPGDILYFAQNGVGVAPGHTSMYVGNDQVIEASSPSTGVRLAPLNNAWNTTTGKFQWAGPPKGFRAGGFVMGQGGPRSDMIPAMLSNGEYVMKAGAVQKYGRGMLDQINAGNFNMGSAKEPTFTMPISPDTPAGVNNYGGSNSNVKIIINGASGKSANAIANKVASMINSSNNRRNHSRSI